MTSSLIGAVAVSHLDGARIGPAVAEPVAGVRLQRFLAAVSDQAWSTTGSAS